MSGDPPGHPAAAASSPVARKREPAGTRDGDSAAPPPLAHCYNLAAGLPSFLPTFLRMQLLPPFLIPPPSPHPPPHAHHACTLPPLWPHAPPPNRRAGPGRAAGPTPPGWRAGVRACVAPAVCSSTLPLLPPQVGWRVTLLSRRGALDSAFPACSSQLLRVGPGVHKTVTKGPVPGHPPPTHMALPNPQSLC